DGKPVWIPDLAKDVNFPRGSVAMKEGLSTGFCFPIKLGDEVLGALECFSREVRNPDETFFQVLAGIGSQIGQFTARKHAEETLRRSERELADFFENASQGLHWVSADGTILRANPAELKML